MLKQLHSSPAVLLQLQLFSGDTNFAGSKSDNARLLRHMLADKASRDAVRKIIEARGFNKMYACSDLEDVCKALTTTLPTDTTSLWV